MICYKMNKKCSKCNIEKELNMFGTFNRKTKDDIILSHKYRCRECETETQRKRRVQQKNKINSRRINRKQNSLN